MKRGVAGPAQGQRPCRSKMPSMPQGHEHAGPGSQLPLTPPLVLLRRRGCSWREAGATSTGKLSFAC